MNLKDMLGALQSEREPKPLKTLTTVWGENLDTNHVLEEYPRPQLVRDNYEILNGYWNYAITKSNKRPKQFDGQILVPFSPESSLSGVNRTLKPDEYLWYERTLHVNAFQKGERQLLHFGAVDQCACVYINGHALTRHVGGYLPFEIDITSHLKEGDNTLRLTLRVQDFSDTSWHTRGKQKLHPGGMYYTAQSGIWQTVWMERVPNNYISQVDIRPDLDGSKITIGVLPFEFMDNATMEVKIFEPTLNFDVDHQDNGLPVLTTKTLDGYDATMEIPVVKSWNPKEPWLYPVEITLDNDTVRSYFAMRKFSIETDAFKKPRVCLNHENIFLNGLLDQGYWPDGLYTAPSDDALIYDITKMKSMGFNMLRKHAKIEGARWYYHCDRLGMLVWQDMVNGGTKDKSLLVTYLPTFTSVPGPTFKEKPDSQWRDKIPAPIQQLMYGATGRNDCRSRDEFIFECLHTIETLKAFPSIMAWVPFNEGWGQFDTPFIEQLIRSLDDQRFIDTSSGWFDCGGGDFKSVHNYFRKLAPINDYRPYVLSEFGGYTYHTENHCCTDKVYGYHSYASLNEFNAAVEELFTNKIKTLIPEGLCGTVYTQVSDIEEEINGLMTYDRKVCKLSDSTIKHIREVLDHETQL